MGLLSEAAAPLWAPGLTTKPVIEPPRPPPTKVAPAVSARRSLGNVELSTADIDQLFTM